MENKELNLCEILKDCSTGTKFWSPVWGDVTFVQINDVGVFPIVLSAKSFSNISLRSNGKMYDIKEAEWMLEKAVQRFANEVSEFDTLLYLIDKTSEGLINKENTVEKFRKAMEE